MTLQQALRQSSGSSQDAAPTWLKALKHLHLVVITIRGYDLIETEILTRELRMMMNIIFELDDEWEGYWRRRLWVGR